MQDKVATRQELSVNRDLDRIVTICHKMVARKSKSPAVASRKAGANKKGPSPSSSQKKQQQKVGSKRKPQPETSEEESSKEETEEVRMQTKGGLSSDDDSESGNDSDSSSDDEEKVSKKKVGSSKAKKAAKQDEQSSEDESDDESGSEDDGQKEKFFTDQNASWLKPKKGKSQLLSSDDEEGDDDDDELVAAGRSDDEDSEEELEIERQSRLLDAEMRVEEEEAEEEMRETVKKHTAVYHLPTAEELEADVDRVVPPSEMKSHIDEILEVLADFKERREAGRARSEYIERLAGFMAELFGYLPELMEYFLSMFSPAEALEFVEFSDKPRPLVIRTNTLKTRRKDLALALMKRGVSLDPLANWSKVGLKIIESPVPVGATPEYLSGQYMLQSAASMCPVMALSPEPKERILDMSAAPGGKTSYIAQLMRNTGVLFANDLRPDRQKSTVANMHRLGVKNVVTCTHDGRKLPQIFKHYKFDRILLDAPCSGLGVISRDPSVKVQRTIADVNKCAHLQKELLLAAIDVLNHKSKSSGGIMVYSTCSVSVAENEEVINYALAKRDIKIIDSGLDFGEFPSVIYDVEVSSLFHYCSI